MVHHRFGSSYKQVFPTALANYCVPLFLDPGDLLDFGAPNTGRRHIACSWRQGGGCLGGLPHALEGWRFRPQQVSVAEAQLRPPRRLPGVSMVEMAGC